MIFNFRKRIGTRELFRWHPETVSFRFSILRRRSALVLVFKKTEKPNLNFKTGEQLPAVTRTRTAHRSTVDHNILHGRRVAARVNTFFAPRPVGSSFVHYWAVGGFLRAFQSPAEQYTLHLPGRGLHAADTMVRALKTLFLLRSRICV